MPVINYTFDTPANYVFNASEIDVAGGSAALLLQSAAMLFNQSFANDTGFIYDNTRAEFLAGVVQQRNITPTGSIFGVRYDINAATITNHANLNWRNDAGSLVATLNGLPVITGNRLVCVGTQGLYYQRDATIIETHKFLYRPNYNTSPPSNINIFSTWNGTNNNDRFFLTHSPSGDTLRLTLDDDTGTSVIAVATAIGAAWQPDADQEYEFEIVIDSVNDLVRVFINGVLWGTNSPGAWTRGTAATRCYLGACPAIYDTAQGDFNQYITFSNAQHSAGYTPGYAVSVTIYDATNVLLPDFAHSGLGALVSLIAMTTTQTGTPQYTIAVDGNAYQYWTGAAWTASDGTYLQSNDLATLSVNLPILPDVNGALVVSVGVHFEASNTQSNVDDLILNHNGNTSYPLTDPTIAPAVTITQDALLQFNVTTSVPGADLIRYTLSVDAVEYWYDGAAWSVANGTYAQSNDIATIQTNLSTFSIVGILVPVIYLHSDNGLTTPSIADMSISFDFFAGATTPEGVCAVFGYLYDELDKPVVGTIVTVTPTSFGVISNKLINRDAKQVTTNATGYWEITLVETETTSNNWAYEFKMPGYTSVRVVPDKASARFNDLAVVNP